MALFRAGPIVGGVSGNLGGSNFALTRYGPVVRKRLQRVHRQSLPQLERRAKFHACQLAWTDFSLELRTLWNTCAANVTFLNRLGMPRRISGFHLFLKMNLAAVYTPLIFSGPPRILITIQSPTNVILSASAAGLINIDWTQPTLAYEPRTIIYGARSMATRPTHHFKLWRYLTAVQKPPGNNNQVITAEWDAALAHPVESELIAAKIVLFHGAYLPARYIEDQTVTVA